MLRILSAKVFREDLKHWSLPMIAFEDFDDYVKEKINVDSGSYKFCLPVSIGDFPETNVPACFSSDVNELEDFVKVQKRKYKRKAFIISDFLVKDLSKICFSGIISTSSKKGMGDFFDKSTTISITLKNPIATYANEGVSPRDLPADIQLTYDHVFNPDCGFPNVDIVKDNIDVSSYKDIIYQAYMASSKIHEVAHTYDGLEYSEHTLFFVDNKNVIHLYEIVGEESFVGRASCDLELIKSELQYD